MEIEGKILEFGEEFSNGDLLSKDCKINTEQLFNSPVTLNFDKNKHVGFVSSIDFGAGEDRSVSVKIKIEKGSIKNVCELLFNSARVKCGGLVVERDENLITKFDLKEVSITSK
jgi:hypothetical protein